MRVVGPQRTDVHLRRRRTLREDAIGIIMTRASSTAPMMRGASERKRASRAQLVASAIRRPWVDLSPGHTRRTDADPITHFLTAAWRRARRKKVCAEMPEEIVYAAVGARGSKAVLGRLAMIFGRKGLE